MAKRQRQAALDNYYKDPNKCLWCKNIIKVRDTERASETKTKKFCSRSCSANHNNRLPGRRKRRRKKKVGSCSRCGVETPRSDRKFCDCCWRQERHKPQGGQNGNKTKKEAGTRIIHHHARWIGKWILKEPRVCIRCGYDLHVELCHIKGVAEFSDDALLSEINAPENLLFLCSNCHWEMDNNYLSSPPLLKKALRLRSSVVKD